MCLPNLPLFSYFRRSPPTNTGTTAIPPLPLHLNSRDEYTREKPWHSGGTSGRKILARAVSSRFLVQGEWARGLTVGYGGIWER